MTTSYPQSFDEITNWAAKQGTTVSESRLRFAQYGVLRAIAISRELSPRLVFKGGNALDLVWLPNRSTRDLDFSLDEPAVAATMGGERLASLLGRALRVSGTSLNITFAVQTVKQQPPGAEKTFITYAIRIGYALQDQARLAMQLQSREPIPQVVPVDISLNEVICATEMIAIDGERELRISTLEDIIAEKLRSLLQQPIRNRTREQDLLDIAVCLRERGLDGVDRVQIADFLLRKARARDVVVSKAEFHNPDVILRARIDYDALATTTRTAFIPFNDALAMLHEFIALLDLPD